MNRSVLVLVLLAARPPGPMPAVAKDDDPRVRWLREEAVAFRTIDPADDDFSDLEPLRAIIGDARIVQLGEQSHGDGATFHVKTRLIRFLHQEMGFDVLAFESGLYDCRKAWEALEAGGQPLASVELGVFPIWTRSAQVLPLIEYLGASARTDRPLELCGFDCQFTGSPSREMLAGELQAFLEHEAERPDPGTSLALASGLEALATGSPPGDEGAWRGAVKRADERLTTIETGEPGRAAEAAFWRQFLRSASGFAAVLRAGEDDQDRLTLAERFNPRDAQMGENMIWLAQERFPERKIIVWAATMHAQRNPHLIGTQTPGFDYAGVEPMGHHLSRALGEAVYTIGFTAYEGQAGLPWGEPWTIAPAGEGSLEALCVEADLENAFVGFRGLTPDAWLREPTVSRPLVHQPMRASWPEVLDGMVFIRRMTPSTARPRVFTEDEKVAARDLLANVQVQWQRVQERLAAGHAYTDKVTFIAEYERWREVIQPPVPKQLEMENEFAAWLADQKLTEHLSWRGLALLARFAADRGDRAVALRHLDRALEAYPAKHYPAPSKQSFFHHLVNEKAMLIWDEDGLDGAIAYAAETLAAEPRCHYFHEQPWMARLEKEGILEQRSVVRWKIAEAYEARGKRFPNEAEAAREHARELAGRD